MYCSYCGEKIPDDSAFCSFCGEKFIAAGQKKEAPNAGTDSELYVSQTLRPGFSDKVNDPAIRSAQKKNKKATRRSGVVLLLAAADLLLFIIIIGAVKDSHQQNEVPTASSWYESVNLKPDDDSSETGNITSDKHDESAAESGEDSETEYSAVNSSDDFEEAAGGDEAAAEVTESPIPSGTYSTFERPSSGEFWWYFDGVYWNGIPENASYITDTEELAGGWKAFIWYDHAQSSDEYSIKLSNLELMFNGNAVTVVLDPYMFYPPGGADAVDISDTGKEKYTGMFDGSEICAIGTGNVIINSFYTLNDGKQYAIGTMELPDNTPTVIALVRP